MTLATLRTGAARLWTWALRRAGERSTWLGLSAAATALGYSAVGLDLTKAADIIPMLLGAGGLALASASTSNKEHAQ